MRTSYSHTLDMLSRGVLRNHLIPDEPARAEHGSNSDLLNGNFAILALTFLMNNSHRV